MFPEESASSFDAQWYDPAEQSLSNRRTTELIAKPPSASEDFLKVPAYPEHINELGHAKAGYVLKLIDIAASIAPKRHVGDNNLVVTASLDRTNFKNPIYRWEFVELRSRLTQVWKSSMEVEVTVSAWSFITNETRSIATAYLVFVALDENRKKIAIPPLQLETEEDKLRAQAAELRKQLRNQEGAEINVILIDDMLDQPVLIERVMTDLDSNAHHNVFGGVLLDLIDEAGSLAAKRLTLGRPVVGVRQDRMSFIAPAFIGETIQARAIITNSWRTSIEVQVEVSSMNPTTGLIRQIANSFLVYVGLGPEGRPVEVPPWNPQTELQIRRVEQANRRRQIRTDEELAIHNASR